MSLPNHSFDFPPYRLSGVVYGVLMNDPASLAALGAAAQEPPYKGAPKAPVLYLKPRNALAASGAELRVPAGHEGVEIGAAVGIVIGQVTCNVPEASALSHVAGYVIVNDVSLPHRSFYRPSIRLKARDGYCPIGPVVVPTRQAGYPDDLNVRVWIDGAKVQETNTRGRARSAARLLADVSEFMTLQPGDILMLGASQGAPTAKPGQRLVIEIDTLGRLENTAVAEEIAA